MTSHLMRRLVVAGAIAAALVAATPLVSCADRPAVTVDAVQADATKAFYGAEAAFRGASMSLEAATDAGLLKGPSAATARDLYAQSHGALVKAREYRRLGQYALALAAAKDATDAAAGLEAVAQSGENGQ